MNALAAAAPSLSDPASKAGLLVSPSLSTASAGAALTANGFLNLISALLGALDSGNAYGDPSAAQPGTELAPTASANAPCLPEASNGDIAQALIRSMLGGKAKPTTPVVDGTKRAQTKARQATGGQGVSPSALPISAPVPIPETPAVDRTSPKAAMPAGSPPVAANGVGNQALQGTGTGSAESMTATVAGAVPSAPLAFSARLTPIENAGAVDPPAELPVAISIDATSKPGAQEPASPRGAVRSDMRDAALPAAAAASSSSSDGFSRGFESPAPPNTAVSDIAEAKPVNAFGSVAETLRTSETPSGNSFQTAAAVTNSPVQEIAVRIAQSTMPVVDLQVIQRCGEIHVAVRTQDASLETLLRQDLGTLTNSLERAGYRAETYVPGSHDEPLKTAASPQMDFGAEREPSGHGSSDRHPGESSQGQQQQRQRHRHAQDWNDEMEKQQ